LGAAKAAATIRARAAKKNFFIEFLVNVIKNSFMQ